MNRLTGMLVLLAAITTISVPFSSYAQSACERNTSLGRYICANDQLRRINIEMDSILSDKVSRVGRDRVPGLVSGIDSWYAATARDCSTGRSFDFSCVREMLTSRRDALRAVDATGTFTAVANAVWINLASRISREAAIDLAYEYYYGTGQRYQFDVFLSSNGWYAVAYGPVWISDFQRQLANFQRAYWDIDPESFPTTGESYVVFVTSVRAPRQSAPAPVASARCSRDQVTERQALCLVYIVGEAACSDGLAQLAADGDAPGVRTSMTASLVCSSISQALRNGDVDIRDLVIGGLLSGIGAVGRDLMREDDLLSQLFGSALVITAASVQMSQALECARAEEEACGY